MIRDEVGVRAPGGKLGVIGLLVPWGMLAAVYLILDLCPPEVLRDLRMAIVTALSFGLIVTGFVGSFFAFRGLCIWRSMRLEIGGSLWVIPVGLIGVGTGMVTCGLGFLLFIMSASQVRC